MLRAHIALIGGQHDRHRVVAFDAKYLLAYQLDILKALPRRQRVDNYEALAIFYVEIAHARELLGAGRVEYFEVGGRVIYFDLFAVEVLVCF